MTRRAHAVWYKAGFFVVLAAVSLAMYVFDLPCVWRKIFGVPCPLCGMTRAVVSILRGRMADAVRYHCMVLCLPILFGFVLADGKLFPWRRADTILLVAILSGFAVRWVVGLM